MKVDMKSRPKRSNRLKSCIAPCMNLVDLGAAEKTPDISKQARPIMREIMCDNRLESSGQLECDAPGRQSSTEGKDIYFWRIAIGLCYENLIWASARFD